MIDCFKYSNYKDLIEALIEDQGPLSGLKTRMARAAGIQPSYLSHVMHGSAQLTPDHAFALARFFKLPPLEADYFLTLVEVERSSNPDYRRYLTQKINSLKFESRKQLTRVADTNLVKMPVEFYEFYYRSWQPAAVHVALSVESQQTEEALLQTIRIFPSELREILQSLKRFGLIENKGKRWIPTASQIHLSKDSPWLRWHALNWRQLAADKVGAADTLSYTDVCAMSVQDENILRSEWSRLIQKFRKTVAASEGEAVYCLNLDFFRI